MCFYFFFFVLLLFFLFEITQTIPCNMQKTKVVSNSLGIGLQVQFLTNNVVFNLFPLQVTNNTY